MESKFEWKGLIFVTIQQTLFEAHQFWLIIQTLLLITDTFQTFSNLPLVLCLKFSSMLLLSMCLKRRVRVARRVRIMNITPIFTTWHRSFRLWRWNFVLQANIFWKPRDKFIPTDFHMEIQLMLELKSLLWSSTNSNRSLKQVSWKNSPPLQLCLKVTTWLTYRTDKFLRVLYRNECVVQCCTVRKMYDRGTADPSQSPVRRISSEVRRKNSNL